MKFVTVSNTDLFPPVDATSSVTIRCFNDTSEDLTKVGIFLRPATITADVDNKPEASPYTDLMDLLRWGERTLDGTTVSGGLKVTRDTNNDIGVEDYFGFQQGSSVSNKLPLKDIGSGSYVDITLTIETPPATASRRFYVEVEVE